MQLAGHVSHAPAGSLPGVRPPREQRRSRLMGKVAIRTSTLALLFLVACGGSDVRESPSRLLSPGSLLDCRDGARGSTVSDYSSDMDMGKPVTEAQAIEAYGLLRPAARDEFRVAARTEKGAHLVSRAPDGRIVKVLRLGERNARWRVLSFHYCF
jgi:hypothetical protein